MKKRIIVLVGLVIVVIGVVVGISYSFFSTGGIQDTANTFTSGCLNITLTSTSNSISMNNTYPITDIEGLDKTSYDFTITNTCSSVANYEINLESISEQANSLNADYIKVSLSSNTTGNIISVLSDNTSITPSISNAYEAYNLYTGTLNGNETKNYKLKLWIDYDATKEEAANKSYQSKINVVANPEIEVIDNLEATYELNDRTLTVNLTDNVTSATYCTTTDNICTPNISANITNNSYTVELEGKEEDQMVCTKLNGTSKVICSDKVDGVEPITIQDLIASKTIDNSRSGNITGTFSGTSHTLYTKQDDWGTSYVYAGNINNNRVHFAGYYWRIIRINGDGSIRMIYNGTSTSGTGTGTQLQKSAYNSNYNDNAYVGYMYGSTGASSYSGAHANTNNSKIKGILDNWYKTNIVDKKDSSGTSYNEYVSTEAGFCNDRKVAGANETWWTDDTKRGYGTNVTAYAPWGRFVTTSGSWNSTQTPTLNCSQSNDLFTTSGSSKGNKKLTYPVGLITSDEVVLAGGFGGTGNSSYYLYTGQTYWTLSPYFFDSGYAYVFVVGSSGFLSGNVNWAAPGVRPVINLNADVSFTGEGTTSNPYEVA